MKKPDSGQSLIEVIAALAVAMIVILALVKITTISIGNASFSRSQALATKFATEWIEEARRLRDSNSADFFTTDSCDQFNNDPDGRGYFIRSRDCTYDGSKSMTVVVSVSWTDSKGPHSSKLETILTNWK